MKRSMKRKVFYFALAGLGLGGVHSEKSEASSYSPLSGATITLNDGDVVTTSNGPAITSITSGGSGVQINGKVTIELNSTSSGFYIKNGAINYLGDGTTITMGSGGTGIDIENSNLLANNLNISMGYGTGIRATQGSKLDIGQGGSITSFASFLNGSTGISASGGAEVKANGINIDFAGTRGSDISGISITSNGKIDLGSNSKIDISAGAVGHGIYISDGSFKAEQLTMTTNSTQYAVQANSGLVDFGSGSKIITNGSYNSRYDTVWVVGGTVKADALTIDTTAASGILVQSGSASIGAGSIIDGSRGTNTSGIISGAYSTYGSNIVADFKGVAGNRNKIISTGTYGGAAQFNNNTLNIAYTDITIGLNSRQSYGLWANGTGNAGGVINADNVSIDATAQTNPYGSVGIYVGYSSKVNLTGDTVISMIPGGSALMNYSYGASPNVVNGSGKMTIAGDMWNIGHGIVDLDMSAGSQFTGMTYTDLWNGAYFKLGLTDSLWEMTDESTVTDLALTNSRVDFVGADHYETLTVENLSGNGIFGMRTDISAGEAGGAIGSDAFGTGGGDLLKVTGITSGNHLLDIQNQGGAAANATYQHLVVQTADQGGNFALSHLVEVGPYVYGLKKESNGGAGQDWYLHHRGLKPVDPVDPIDPVDPVDPDEVEISSTAQSALNEVRASYYLNYAEMNTLIQRMGDLRNNQESAGNVWAKMIYGKNEVDSTLQLSGFDQSYGGIQAGIDKKTAWENGNFYKGVFLGYTKGDQTYSDGDGDIRAKSVGAYATYIGDSGFYVDGVLRFNWQDQSFRAIDTAGQLVKGKSSTTGAMASLEVGNRFHFNKETKQGFYLEPQAQISWGDQSGDRFTASNGLNVNLDDYHSLLGRVGLLAGYELKGGKNPINVYAKASYHHEFEGKYGANMNGAQINGDLGDSWWSYGVGITAQVGKKHNLYVDLERASGGNFTQAWKINAGYRFQW